MYLRLVHHHPALGKNQELRGLIEGQVKAQQAKGAHVALATSVMAREPDFIHAVRHDDFAAWEAHLASNASDKDFQAYATKMQTLVTRFPVQDLYEVLATDRSTSAANFLWSNSFSPATGAGPELRKLLEERVSTSIERGSSGSTLYQRLYGPEGASFMLSVAFADLGSLEKYQKAMQADPGTQKWGAAMAKATAGPPNTQLVRVLMPFPAA